RLGCGSGTVRTRHLARRTAAPGAGPRGALPRPARGARRAHRPSRRRHRAGGAGPDRRTARGGAHRGGDRAPLRAGGHRRRRGERAARASGGPAMTTASSPALRRAVRALEIPRARLLAAVLAACATLGSAFALAAVSAYLVTRAWTMPPVLDLTVAVVAVRALGVSRGAFRWLERMLTHDVALRGVVSLRTNLFTALASRTDDALTRLRRGDLLSRLGDDAQELGDHVITALVPAAVSVVMALVVLATFAPLSPTAATVMLAALVLASGLAPPAAARAGVGAQSLEILDDATSLRVEGRLEDALAALRQRQAEHDAAIDRAAVPAAVASAAVPLTMILAVSGSLLAAGSLWVGGAATAGQIGILLLLPLSSFEAATALPAAAAQHARS